MPVEYTSEDSATLPSDDTDLSHVLDAGELTAISTDDDTTYASITNTAGYAIFQFENDTTGKTAVTVTWDGKSDIAPSSSEVFLQVYNRSGTPAWVTIDSENGVGAGTDFTLTATLNAGSTPTLANCQDGSGIIACRVYQATSGGTLTDLGNTAVGAAGDSGDVGTSIFVKIGPAASSGTLTSIHAAVYNAGNNHNIKMALYANDGTGKPGALIATVNPVTITRTTATVDPSDWTSGNPTSGSVAIVEGQYYFIGLNVDDNNTNYCVVYGGAPLIGDLDTASQTYADFPTNPAPSIAQAKHLWSAYITYSS